MRDIKRYFSNGTKMDEEVIGNTVKQRVEQNELVTMDGRKRKRVKIRISRTASKERICNIVESKNDLIDKTPSPFAKVNDESIVQQDGTPKSCLTNSSIERYLKKNDAEMNGNNNSKDLSGRNKVGQNKLNEPIIVDLDDYSNDSIDSTKFHDDIGSQREESNAFKVLMNRDKPIQYKSLPKETTENLESKESSDNIKELKFERNEKLIALADKKGYSKRKLAEAEESAKIEKDIENRMKFFKCDNERDDNTISTKNKLSGNLLNYFSKSSLELTNKKINNISTFIVKADVHQSDVSNIEPILKPTSNKIYSNIRYSKPNLDLSHVDDIHVIASENLIPSPQTVKQDRRLREKPRWSLRIKLHSTEDNGSWSDTTDDELFSPRSKSKFNTELNKSRKSIYAEEDKKLCSNNLDGHIKIEMRNKKNDSFSEKNSNIQTNFAKHAVISNNNGDSNICLKKSGESSKTEKEFNDVVMIVTDDSECEIVNENILKRKPNEKLAPLFTKRCKTDPTVAAARRLFLQSDITDIENKNKDREMSNNSASMFLFPAISHVTQLENKPNLAMPEIKCRFPIRIERKYSPLIDVCKYKYITNYNKMPKAIEAVNEPMKENLDQIVAEIEKRCPDAQKIWRTILRIKSELEKKSPSRVKAGRKTRLHERKATLMENFKSEEDRLHDCTWTCKYKPMNMQEIVGNEEAAKKLKDWLSGWRASLTKENNSSGDEFYSSDSCGTNENNQVAVLLGPHGSGKSASVYAVAEELGYSVLEVNASSRRTGKRILKELEEATKSHRIKKNKHKSSFEKVAKDNEASKIAQNSLILFEDVDLIFEEDEGFISAVYQLVSNTKRPIVMTCRNVCSHLNKMAPQQNKIYFQKANGSRVSTLLELISLAETRHRLSHNCLTKLLQAGDLRRALLQLQYLLLSGSSVLSEQSSIMKSTLWQDMQYYLYKPAIKSSKRQKTKKSTNINKNNKQANSITCILNNLADDLDSLALVSSLIDVEDIALNSSEVNTQPNLSLAENLSLYSAPRDLNADIASFISDKIIYKDINGNEQLQNQNYIILRQQLNQGVDLALSHITSACLDQRIMATDYLPSARTICRAEESRSNINYKRGNRFFHYLHSLKVPTASIKPNILTAACKMLQDKVDKNAST